MPRKSCQTIWRVVPDDTQLGSSMGSLLSACVVSLCPSLCRATFGPRCVFALPRQEERECRSKCTPSCRCSGWLCTVCHAGLEPLIYREQTALFDVLPLFPLLLQYASAILTQPNFWIHRQLCYFLVSVNSPNVHQTTYPALCKDKRDASVI